MNPGASEQTCQRSLDCAAPQELMGSVVPYIEHNYRAAPGARNRALAGLSVGGDVVRNTLFHYPDAFAYAGFFSGGQMPPEVITDPTQNHADLLTGLAKSNSLKLLWISFGGEESLVSNHQHWLADTNALFDKYGVKYTYVDGPTFGAIYGHVWDTWRKDLLVFAPRLFDQRGHHGVARRSA
jgi:enterochelin esterase-like enzyme